MRNQNPPIGMCAALVACLCFTANNAFADVKSGSAGESFSVGERIECQRRDPRSPIEEDIVLIVTGLSTQRELSSRANFQNDGVIVSVALLDMNPVACKRAKSFRHIGFTIDALQKCGATKIDLVDVPNILTKARSKWISGMKHGKGVIVSLHPSRFLALVRQKRC